MEKLTDKQRAEYLESAQHIQRCPYCKSEDIDSTEPFDGVSQSCACSDCKAQWIDHYTLTGVEETKSPHCITIIVKGGCVEGVDYLPDGWLYKINDLDNH